MWEALCCVSSRNHASARRDGSSKLAAADIAMATDVPHQQFAPMETVVEQAGTEQAVVVMQAAATAAPSEAPEQAATVDHLMEQVATEKAAVEKTVAEQLVAFHAPADWKPRAEALSKRFPAVPLEEVVVAIKSCNGHAGMASKALVAKGGVDAMALSSQLEYQAVKGQEKEAEKKKKEALSKHLELVEDPKWLANQRKVQSTWLNKGCADCFHEFRHMSPQDVCCVHCGAQQS
jgi:hypothetical protein